LYAFQKHEFTSVIVQIILALSNF